MNSSVDGAIGYATTELGPRWHQRQPLPITRWRTLLIKWTIGAGLTAVVSGLMIAVAVGVGLDVPHPAGLWLYAWLCSASVAIGTIVLFAVVGTPGQLVALLLFVYLGLASAGGTVPLEALPAYLRWVGQIEPLRQVLAGTRSILYFGARWDAGLTRGVLAAGLGLLFWQVAGAAMVRWYDRSRFYRMDPDLLAYVSGSVQGYKTQQGSLEPADSDTTDVPDGEDDEDSSGGQTGPSDVDSNET